MNDTQVFLELKILDFKIYNLILVQKVNLLCCVMGTTVLKYCLSQLYGLSNNSNAILITSDLFIWKCIFACKN